jgi:hypothetical protein
MLGYGSRRFAGGAESAPRGRLTRGPGRIITSLALCLVAAGCSSLGPTLGSLAQAGSAKDFSIAFESIDGLPREVSQRLLHDLSEEAAALRIAVAPAGSDATYRLRGYLAAHAGRPAASTTSIAWAWDVYDGELHRAFRLSGEEQGGPASGRDAGGALADDAVLRAIAHAGMQQLADFAALAPAPAAPPSGSIGSAVANRGEAPSEPALGAETVAAPAPVPARRAGLTAPAWTADAIAGR